MWQTIQKNLSLPAAVVAGLMAGTVYLAVMVVLLPLVASVDGTLFIRYAGSLALGGTALVENSALVIFAGLAVHYLLSILFAIVIAVVVFRWGMLVGVVGGALLGACLYAINLYLMTLIFPWFFAINTPVLLVAHVLFGAVAGGIYEALDQYDLPLVKERSK